MPDITKIKVQNIIYDLKDDTARTLAQEAKNATDDLGTLAYQNSADGTFTPAGTVSKPNVNLTSTTANVKSCESTGSLPQWTAAVNSETLSFTFNAGTLPSVSNVSINNVTAAELAAAPSFTGTAGTVTVS